MALMGHYASDEFEEEFGAPPDAEWVNWWVSKGRFVIFLKQVLPHCQLTPEEADRLAKAQLAAEKFGQSPDAYQNWGHMALAVVLSRRLPDELIAFKARLRLLGDE